MALLFNSAVCVLLELILKFEFFEHSFKRHVPPLPSLDILNIVIGGVVGCFWFVCFLIYFEIGFILSEREGVFAWLKMDRVVLGLW